LLCYRYFILAGVIPLNVALLLFLLPLLLLWPEQLPQMPRRFSSLSRFFSFSQHNRLITAPQFISLVSAIPRLPSCNFSKGQQDQSIAVPRFFKRLVRSTNCHATIFQEARAIPQLPCHNFSRGRHNSPIAVPQFFKKLAESTHCRAAIFQEAVVIPRLPCRN
jgi:hypothetical protein